MPKTNLLRPEAAVFLTEAGYPTTKFSLQKMASTGGGPVYRIFGNKALYQPDELLEWARAKISAPRRSTSEAHEAERLELAEDEAEQLEGAAR